MSSARTPISQPAWAGALISTHTTASAINERHDSRAIGASSRTTDAGAAGRAKRKSTSRVDVVAWLRARRWMVCDVSCEQRRHASDIARLGLRNPGRIARRCAPGYRARASVTHRSSPSVLQSRVEDLVQASGRAPDPRDDPVVQGRLGVVVVVVGDLDHLRTVPVVDLPVVPVPDLEGDSARVERGLVTLSPPVAAGSLHPRRRSSPCPRRGTRMPRLLREASNRCSGDTRARR